MDLIVRGNDHYIASIGIGGDDALRDEYGKAGEHLGTLVSGKLGSDEHEVFADILGFEADENPDGTDVDSNPAGIARAGDGSSSRTPAATPSSARTRTGGCGPSPRSTRRTRVRTPCPPPWCGARTVRGTSAS